MKWPAETSRLLGIIDAESDDSVHGRKWQMNAGASTVAIAKEFVQNTHCYCGKYNCIMKKLLIIIHLMALSFLTNGLRAERPNIVLIMSDDMGYSDISCYGGEIDTPNLDSLAHGGLQFTQFYNTGRCCPTRASLLTGLYPHQAGVGWMMSDSGHDGYRGDLNQNCRTIAEVLRPAGYSTYMSGKWHVTKQESATGEQYNWPLQRGFDRFYGTISGAGSFWDPWSLVRQNTPISSSADPEYAPDVYYYTHAISDQAVRFIEEHHVDAADKPFFLYVAYTAAHWPMHALPEDIDKYRGRFDKGYQRLREERFERMRKLGLVGKHWELSKPAEDWSQVKNREWELRNMEVYAAMVDSMDQGIGSIIGALKAADMFENTLILYLQDNGGCAEGLGRSPRGGVTTRPSMATLPQMAATDLQTKMIPDQTRDGYPTVMGPGIMPGPDGTYIAYGRGWANVSNTPFREYKHWVHEGGISTPLIAHWPEGIKRQGKFERQPGHLIDVMATCVDLAQAEYPEKIGDNVIKPLEGRSLNVAFQGKNIEREALFWEHEGNRAVREGDWKLVAKGVNGAWELYDIGKDRTEQHNLIEQEPEIATRLEKKFEAYARRANVYPLVPYRNRPPKLSNRRLFDLKHGDVLAQKDAPNIVGKSFELEAELSSELTQGVIVAQGGTSHGWSLFLNENMIRVSARIGGKLVVIKSDKKLPSSNGNKTVGFSYSKDGQISVKSGETVLLEGNLGGSMVEVPLDPLEVGKDTNGIVGPYPSGWDANGEVIKVRLEIGNK